MDLDYHNSRCVFAKKQKGSDFFMPKAKKLPSGNWRVQVYSHTDGNGKKVYRSFTGSTKKEAEFLAVQFSQNKKAARDPLNLTLGEATKRFIQSRDGVLSPSTIQGYEKILANAMPELWGIKLSALTSDVVQGAVNRYAKEPSLRTGRTRSAKTVANAYGLISAVMREYSPDNVIHVRLPVGYVAVAHNVRNQRDSLHSRYKRQRSHCAISNARYWRGASG